jgi:hypothetical protein
MGARGRVNDRPDAATRGYANELHQTRSIERCLQVIQVTIIDFEPCAFTPCPMIRHAIGCH